MQIQLIPNTMHLQTIADTVFNWLVGWLSLDHSFIHGDTLEHIE